MRTALITGASDGIGLELARVLAVTGGILGSSRATPTSSQLNESVD